jgi:hypothetical protein
MAPGQDRQSNNFNNGWNPNQNTWNVWQNNAGAQPQRRFDRSLNNNNNATVYYNYDPVAAWAPRIYQTYSYDNGYNYAPDYYGYPQPRDTVVRTIISSFFAPDEAYYTTFDTPYAYNADPYYGYVAPNYYYSNAGYAPDYYYDQGYYDPYGYSGVPMFASPFYGENSLKANLLNFGVQMLQGMLGQGYNQGLNDAQYVRVAQGPVYYDPYQAQDAAYYSPYASSFADQRQIFEQGYQLGYEDAMRNQDPYGAYNNNARVDLVSQFLANSVLGS